MSFYTNLEDGFSEVASMVSGSDMDLVMVIWGSDFNKPLELMETGLTMVSPSWGNACGQAPVFVPVVPLSATNSNRCEESQNILSLPYMDDQDTRNQCKIESMRVVCGIPKPIMFCVCDISFAEHLASWIAPKIPSKKFQSVILYSELHESRGGGIQSGDILKQAVNSAFHAKSWFFLHFKVTMKRCSGLHKLDFKRVKKINEQITNSLKLVSNEQKILSSFVSWHYNLNQSPQSEPSWWDIYKGECFDELGRIPFVNNPQGWLSRHLNLKMYEAGIITCQ